MCGLSPFDSQRRDHIDVSTGLCMVPSGSMRFAMPTPLWGQRQSLSLVEAVDASATTQFRNIVAL
jgi:hypothetical protein